MSWLCPDLALGKVFLSKILGALEHQDGVVDLQCGAQFDLHHFDDVRLCQKQEGFAVNLLQRRKHTQMNTPVCGPVPWCPVWWYGGSWPQKEISDLRVPSTGCSVEAELD